MALTNQEWFIKNSRIKRRQKEYLQYLDSLTSVSPFPTLWADPKLGKKFLCYYIYLMVLIEPEEDRGNHNWFASQFSKETASAIASSINVKDLTFQVYSKIR